jgi:magnesium-transporting ATPase (P-type)
MSSNIAQDVFIRFFRTAASFNATYLQISTIEMIVDSALLFCVLVEVAWSVLRPIKSSLSRGSLIVVAALILLAGAAIWPFAAFAGLAHAASKQWLLLTQLVHTVSILRMLFFLLLAGGSQLLSIGWRDRELQIATGLGFYSFVTVAVSILQAHQTTRSQYVGSYEIGVAAFLGSLLYWTYCFAQKEAERREFTPEMQRILLSVAGAAHSTRVALTEPQTAKPHNHDRR